MQRSSNVVKQDIVEGKACLLRVDDRTTHSRHGRDHAVKVGADRGTERGVPVEIEWEENTRMDSPAGACDEPFWITREYLSLVIFHSHQYV